MNKKWNLLFSASALKCLEKIDLKRAKEIMIFLKERIINLEDPRLVGKPLKGPFKTFWCYRKGDYRMIVDIQDKDLMIQIIEIDHRSKIYKH